MGVDRLSKELSEEKTKKEELSKKVEELVSTNTTLQQLVGTAQEALEKENRVVNSIQDQITPNKDEILANGPSATEEKNGKIMPATSTPSIASIDSTTNTTPEKKKKSKKKKVVQ